MYSQFMCVWTIHMQARVQGGPRGLAPPPLEIEKQKKKKKGHQNKY